MSDKMSYYIPTQAILVTVLLFLSIVRSDSTLIPADSSQINTWFNQNVGPLSSRKSSLDPALVAAEANVTVIKVKADGSGDFKTITDAIKSIPTGNKNRVIISIGTGNYTEKINIDRDRPFITFYGDPNNMPTLVFDGTAAKYGTVYSGTLTVESDYFNAVNLKIVNSSPRPDGKRVGAQAVAMRIRADKASFYNCRFHGFQDTLLDDEGKHFYKDCYVEGTVDFIFGSGTSLYLNSELHVIPGDQMAMITAQARKTSTESSGYSFVHCKVTGSGGIAYLGRAWMAAPRVVYSYSDFSDAVNPQGWSDDGKSSYRNTAFFGEYKNTGAGAKEATRVSYMKKLTDAEVKQFLSLDFIEGSKWLLPPAKV